MKLNEGNRFVLTIGFSMCLITAIYTDLKNKTK